MLNIFEKAFWEAYEESKETREFLRRKSEEYTAAKARMATNAVNGHGAGISQSSETER